MFCEGVLLVVFRVGVLVFVGFVRVLFVGACCVSVVVCLRGVV